MSQSSGKNILVTGGAGFIGSHLCERLLTEGHQVICLDNFSTSHEQNIHGLLEHPKFKFLRRDINEPFDPEAFPELSSLKIKLTGIEEIYHLACPTTIKKFDQYRLQTLFANSVGTRFILDLAVKYRSRVLFASSSVIYGGRGDGRLVFPEEMEGIFDHLSPRACYDEGKRFAETMFATYAQVHGLETKIARIFRTYGPRMPLFDGHLIPDFILDAVDGRPVTIYGDQSFRTSLCYVTDIVDGLFRLMAAPNDVRVVNLGSDQDLEIAEVARRVIEMTGSSSEIKFEPGLKFLTSLGLPDIRRAKEMLGWLPLVRLEDGLTRTIEYIRANKIILGAV